MDSEKEETFKNLLKNQIETEKAFWKTKHATRTFIQEYLNELVGTGIVSLSLNWTNIRRRFGISRR